MSELVNVSEGTTAGREVAVWSLTAYCTALQPLLGVRQSLFKIKQLVHQKLLSS